jgi:hypothetical protein
MSDWIFFYPTRYYLGGECLVRTLQCTLKAKSDEQAERLRQCCIEHVRWLEES